MRKVLQVSGVSFAYGQREILHDVSLAMHSGEILCLMGPNGSGKTTLLDTVMDIHQPASGNIELLNRPLTSYKRHEIAQNMAYVPQIHDITFPYTVKEIVMMGRTAYTGFFGEPQPEDEEISLQALAKIGILEFADKPYSKLSGGEVKLVLLARALGQRTSLIIMDEPTAHLDFRNELLFLETIVDLCTKEDIAVLMATHSPSHAFYFAAKKLNCHAAMMNKGKMISYGTPEKVVTEKNIREVYGVKTKITSEWDEQGLEMKTVTLFQSV